MYSSMCWEENRASMILALIAASSSGLLLHFLTSAYLLLLSVCFADTHDVYFSTSHFFSYLRNVTTSVQCTYIPVSDLHDVLEVYQWPIQLGGVLLDRPQCSLDKVNFLYFWFL